MPGWKFVQVPRAQRTAHSAPASQALQTTEWQTAHLQLGTFLVGRSTNSTADVQLGELCVSRRHATLKVLQDLVTVADNGSKHCSERAEIGGHIGLLFGPTSTTRCTPGSTGRSSTG